MSAFLMHPGNDLEGNFSFGNDPVANNLGREAMLFFSIMNVLHASWLLFFWLLVLAASMASELQKASYLAAWHKKMALIRFLHHLFLIALLRQIHVLAF